MESIFYVGYSINLYWVVLMNATYGLRGHFGISVDPDVNNRLIRANLLIDEYNKKINSFATAEENKIFYEMANEEIDRAANSPKPGKILLKYQKCINQIDDYLEYNYKEKSAEEIRNTILEIIDKLTERLKEL